MKYYLVAGEASGDLHGSNLMKELKVADQNAVFRFFGGDLMQKAGGDLVKHYREMAFMGIVNVILNIKTINRNMELCKADLLEFKPDVLILIDYPGFNLRIAEFAKQNNIKVFYYISPKIWAWKEYRVKKIKSFVDEMFTIFPFETEFYEKHSFKVNYVGNPLMDSKADFEKEALPKHEFLDKHNLGELPIVAILAGSRVQEIKRLLPVMLEAVIGIDNFQFVIAGVKSVGLEVYNSILNNRNIPIIFDDTYNLLNNAHTAIVASGTAALETALFHVPQVVLYKVEGGWFIDILMRQFVLKTKYVSLPNIIMGKETVRELIQMQMTLKNIKKELNSLLFESEYRNSILEDYRLLHNLMGEVGCSKRAAKEMVALLN